MVSPLDALQSPWTEAQGLSAGICRDFKADGRASEKCGDDVYLYYTAEAEKS